MKDTLIAVGSVFGIFFAIFSIVSCVALVTGEVEIRRACNTNTDFAFRYSGLSHDSMTKYYEDCVKRASFLK